VRATLIGAAVVGAAATVAPLFLRRVRDIEEARIYRRLEIDVRRFQEAGGGARRFKLRVRERSALQLSAEHGATFRTAGQEVVLSEIEAAAILRRKGRRILDLVEVIDDSVTSRRKLPG
jgi:hypothetical protein